MEKIKYFIEVKDDEIIKRISHDNEKHCLFVKEDKAKEFKKKLKECCPHDKFRLVTVKETYEYGNWE